MSEWVNEWSNEWTREQTNERMSEWINKRINKSVSELVSKYDVNSIYTVAFMPFLLNQNFVNFYHAKWINIENSIKCTF